MAITLLNTTSFDAQFKVLKGEQVVVSLPAIPKNGSVQIPTGNNYTVTASTTIDGNVYTSAPISVDGGAGFLAQVIQNKLQQTYIFDMKKVANTKPNQLQFEKTCLSDVIFTISKDGQPLQSIAVSDSFMQSSLTLSDTYTISAVINGVTTDVTTTSNVNATITATDDTAAIDKSYFTLELT